MDINNLDYYEYKFNDKHYKWMMEQQWEAREQGIEYYHKLAQHEFKQFVDQIDQPKVVLELGCGLGRSSVYLNHLLKDDSVQFVLADRDGKTDNTGAFNPETDEYYNDLEQTEDFCKYNGIKNIITMDTESDAWNTIPKADLILSTCSFGMHVAIERYMERILIASKPTTTMIFGTRANYGPNSFRNRFQEVLFRPGPDSRPYYPIEHWLILKNPLI